MTDSTAVAPGLDDAITARKEKRQDGHGPYWAILLRGRMLAYCDDEASADLVVAAVNMATFETVVANWASRPTGKAQ